MSQQTQLLYTQPQDARKTAAATQTHVPVRDSGYCRKLSAELINLKADHREATFRLRKSRNFFNRLLGQCYDLGPSHTVAVVL